MKNTSSGTEILNGLTSPCRYDRFTRPLAGEAPVRVHVRMHVYFLGAIEAQSLQFSAHILLRLRWTDPRLEYDKVAPHLPLLVREGTPRERLWTPHIYLVNERESVVMGADRKDVLVTVQPDGTVILSARMKVTLFCLMNLQKFPFDQQHCPLVMESSRLSGDGEQGPAPDRVPAGEPPVQLQLRQLLAGGVGEPHVQPALLHVLRQVRGQLQRADGALRPGPRGGPLHHGLLRAQHPPRRRLVGLLLARPQRRARPHHPRHQHDANVHHADPQHRKFLAQSVVHQSDGDLVHRVHRLHLRLSGRVRLRQHHLAEEEERGAEEGEQQVHPQVHADPDDGEEADGGLFGVEHRPLPVVALRGPGGLRQRPQVLHRQLNSIDSVRTDPGPGYNEVVIPVPTPGAPPGNTNTGFTTMTPQQIAQWIDKRSRVFFPATFILFNVLYWGFVWM
ncbi:hypothetical protein C0J52_00638 [Blattella germanica]|nr:hypothetical protein C0J52_00638 [Blattella germanica]